MHMKKRVSNASGFYLRAIASPVNNSAQLRAIQEQLRATELRLETEQGWLPSQASFNYCIHEK